MPERTKQTTGMVVMFWSWMAIVIVGLSVMITVPLGGR